MVSKHPRMEDRQSTHPGPATDSATIAAGGAAEEVAGATGARSTATARRKTGGERVSGEERGGGVRRCGTPPKRRAFYVRTQARRAPRPSAVACLPSARARSTHVSAAVSRPPSRQVCPAHIRSPRLSLRPASSPALWDFVSGVRTRTYHLSTVSLGPVDVSDMYVHDAYPRNLTFPYPVRSSAAPRKQRRVPERRCPRTLRELAPFIGRVSPLDGRRFRCAARPAAASKDDGLGGRPVYALHPLFRLANRFRLHPRILAQTARIGSACTGFRGHYASAKTSTEIARAAPGGRCSGVIRRRSTPPRSMCTPPRPFCAPQTFGDAVMCVLDVVLVCARADFASM